MSTQTMPFQEVILDLVEEQGIVEVSTRYLARAFPGDFREPNPGQCSRINTELVLDGSPLVGIAHKQLDSFCRENHLVWEPFVPTSQPRLRFRFRPANAR